MHYDNMTTKISKSSRVRVCKYDLGYSVISEAGAKEERMLRYPLQSDGLRTKLESHKACETPLLKKFFQIIWIVKILFLSLWHR